MVILHKKFCLTAIIYIYLSVFIFLLGWVRWYISIPAVILGGFGVYQYLKNYEIKINKPHWIDGKKGSVKTRMQKAIL